MKHLNKLLLSFLCMSLLLTSCKDDDYDVTPVLDLDASELNFTLDANAQTIVITANSEDTVYAIVSPEAREWLSATVNEAQTAMEIQVTENTTNADRSSEVTVMIYKGNLTKQVRVNQSGSLSAVLSLEKVRSTALGRTGIEVYVEGNYSGNISVSTLLDWIDITEVENTKFYFDIKENTFTDTRSGEITVSVDNVELTLSVWQDGVFTFQLPYLKLGYDYTNNNLAYPNNITEIFDFEESRGNTYIYSPMNITHMFSTVSTIVPSIIYTTEQSEFYIKAAFYDQISEDLSANDSYLDYMASEGFELLYSESDFMVMWNSERMVSVNYNPQANMMSFLHSRYKPHHHSGTQTYDLETFSEIQYPFMEFGSTLDAINEWEAAKGSTPLDKGPSNWTFTPNGEEYDPLERAYVIDSSNGLTSVIVLYENLELAMYPYPQLQFMAYACSKEFTQLLEANGFVLSNYGTDSAEFVNTAKGISLLVSVQGFASEDYLPRLVLLFKPAA